MNSFLRELLDPNHGDVFNILTASPWLGEGEARPPAARSHSANLGLPAGFITKSRGCLPYPTYVCPVVRRFIEDDRQRLGELGAAPRRRDAELRHERPASAGQRQGEERQRLAPRGAEPRSQMLEGTPRAPWRPATEDVAPTFGARREPPAEEMWADVELESVTTFRSESISLACPGRGSARSAEVANVGGSMSAYVSGTAILFCSMPGRASYPTRNSLDVHGTRLSRRSAVTHASRVAESRGTWLPVVVSSRAEDRGGARDGRFSSSTRLNGDHRHE